MKEDRKARKRARKLEGVTADLAWSGKPHQLWLYRFLQVVTGPIIRGTFRTRRIGWRTIPRTGPVILVTNHASYLDPVLVVGSLPRPVFHLARHDIFKKGFRRWLFLHGGGQIPVNRNAPQGNEAAIRAAVRVLEAGGALAIYPEGARSPDGKLRRGRRGLGRIAYLTGAPCYPVAVDRTWIVWPKGRAMPTPFRRTRVIVGEPRAYARDPAKADDPKACQAVVDEMMADLARLLGQPYDPKAAAQPL